MKAFQVQVDANQFVHICFDLPQEKVNIFNLEVAKELADILEDLKERIDKEKLQALIFKSGKKNVFIAGADIHIIESITTEADARKKAEAGHALFNQLANFPLPTFAWIDGVCLGGGLEMALACDYRLVSEHPKTQLGLPEVNLGILPGWGGTQRLPRLVGLKSSLSLILSGKPIAARKAWKMGLADALFSKELFEIHALNFVKQALEKKPKRKKRGFVETYLIEKNPLGRKLLFWLTRKHLYKKTGGNYPAPLKALKVIERTFGLSAKKGNQKEIQAFAELATTSICKNLIRLFFIGETLKKGSANSSTIHKTAVMGGGVMGGGIAWLFSYRDHPVRLKDINWKAIASGYAQANKIYGQLLKIRKLKPHEINRKMHHLSGSTDFSGFGNVDLVVEAIVEDLDVKKKVLAQLEEHVKEKTIICTNTSSFSVETLAKSLKHPERFLGMHFFNPVNRMPLVEIIPGSQTAPEVVEACVSFLQKAGKTPIVVGDCPGFLVNRILLPYLNEAIWMWEEGFDFEKIDRALENFGMPMGPFALVDKVGIDIAHHAGKTLEQAYGSRMEMSSLATKIFEEKLLGEKGKKGFYLYDGKKKKKRNPQIDAIQPVVHAVNDNLPPRDIVLRLTLTMVNEAARALEENIVKNAEELDMAMLMGAGFPPFHGGLMRYADSIDLNYVTEYLQQLQARVSPRFKPANLLVEKVNQQSSFT